MLLGELQTYAQFTPSLVSVLTMVAAFMRATWRTDRDKVLNVQLKTSKNWRVDLKENRNNQNYHQRWGRVGVC